MSVKSKVIINTTQANSRILDDSDEIIQNDEFVGEMPKYEYIINKEISNNYNNNNYHDNVKFYNRNDSSEKYNNNSYYFSDSKNNYGKRNRIKKYEYGNIVEERRNYRLYLSGCESYDNVFSEDENEDNKYKRISKINRVNLFKNNSMCNYPILKSYDCYNHYNYNSNKKIVRSNRNLNNNYSSSSFRNTHNYICYSSPIKKTCKSPYNLRSKGILKDNLYEKYYRVYKAIPIYNTEIRIINNNNYKKADSRFNDYKIFSAKRLCYKNNGYNINNCSNYKNKNKNNFLINSNDINKVADNKNILVFKKPKIPKNNNCEIIRNIYKVSNMPFIYEKTEINQKTKKPIYLKKKICSNNNSINNHNNNMKKTKNNNNNFVEIKESNKNINNNNNYLVIKESIRKNNKNEKNK